MPDKTPRVCTSAGHGIGSRQPGQVDPGAEFVNSPSTEADVTLTIAKHLDADYSVLFEKLPGSYHMLRNGGVYYRADDEAYAHACDIFDEIHTDATTLHPKADGKKVGTSVLYEDIHDKAYAEKMSHDVAAALRLPNRGASHRPDLAVLNPHPGMKQVIIEVMFGTDADDVAAYRTHREAMEIAILNVNLDHWGMRRIKSLPRKWSPIFRAWYRARRFSR